MSKGIDILNLEWPNSDRDIHIVTPILIYLQKKEKINFVTKSIFNGYYNLLKYRPKMLLISNFSGDRLNHEIVKLAYTMGIKVVSLISEGNVKEEAAEQFLWGWNKDKVLYLDKMLLWSKRSENIFLASYPQFKQNLVTVGATGFDRYKLLDFIKKDDFLKENDLDFKKVIGIAAWGFDHFFGEYFIQHKKYHEKVYGKEQIQMHRDDLVKLQKIYRQLIEENSDILFILRYHPGTLDATKNEFFGLENYKNVFISHQNKNEKYSISNLINISDIWIGYETTTALEAWLLAKETFLINPTKSDFIRENIYKGSPIVTDANTAQLLIDEYFKNNKIKSFQELATRRIDIIVGVIEYEDGKNYIRAGNEILKVFKLPDRKFQFTYKILPKISKQTLQMILAKTIMKNHYNKKYYFDNFADKYLEEYKKVIDA